MKPSKRIVAGIASAALVVGVGAGIADAAQKSSSPDAGSAAAGGPPPGRGGGGPGSAAIASYLGLTAAELRTQLQSGKTLADIATAQGKTVSGLEDAIVADAKTHLDADVTAGKLTAAQEATMLADLKSHVDDMVNGVAPADGHGPGGPGGGQAVPAVGPFDLSAVTDYLGLTAAQLRTQQEAARRSPTSRRRRARPSADSRTRSSPPRRRSSTRTSRPASSRPRRRRRSSPT